MLETRPQSRFDHDFTELTDDTCEEVFSVTFQTLFTVRDRSSVQQSKQVVCLARPGVRGGQTCPTPPFCHREAQKTYTQTTIFMKLWVTSTQTQSQPTNSPHSSSSPRSFWPAPPALPAWGSPELAGHRRQVGKYSPCTLQVSKRNSHGHAGVSPHTPLLSFHHALQATEDNFIL